MGSLVYTELLNKPKYRKFLHGMFPWIGHVGICHAFMIPLIGAAKNCRSGFVEFQCDPWTANPWVRPLIGKNMEGLTLKLEKFVDSILKYARPDLMIVDTDWCQKYFLNRRHFIGYYGIFHSEDFLLSVKVQVKFSANGSGQLPIMGSGVMIELTFEDIKEESFDEQVLRLHFSVYTLFKG